MKSNEVGPAAARYTSSFIRKLSAFSTIDCQIGWGRRLVDRSGAFDLRWASKIRYLASLGTYSALGAVRETELNIVTTQKFIAPFRINHSCLNLLILHNRHGTIDLTSPFAIMR
jgi:hypothetical protein